MTQPELGVVTHRLFGSLILGAAVALAVRVSGLDTNPVPVLDEP